MFKMGILDFFKRKKDPGFSDSSDALGVNDDPFKADPFMDPDSGLNLPKDDPGSSENPFIQSSDENPFKKYNRQNEFQDFSNQGGQQQGTQNNSEINSKDLQIINAKLDALRAEIQNLNHKIENMERKHQKKMW